MHIRLDGRTALVTGSTRGIGYATARMLGDAGAEVIVNGRTQAAVDDALATLRRDVPAGAFRGLVADIASADGAAQAARQESALDILVCNAATFDWTAFFDTQDADWQRHFEINVMSGVRLARQFMQGMLERNWGRIVLVASEAGLNIPADMIHYGMSKTALLGLARGLAKRAAGSQVTVNSVLPGPTLSEGAAAMLQASAPAGQTLEQAGRAFVQAHRPSSIIGRAARMEEVAALVAYTVSPLASATTGAALRVEGGVVDSI